MERGRDGTRPLTIPQEPLRVGVVAGSISPSDGGAWTFAAMISKAIQNSGGQDTFVWLDAEFEAVSRSVAPAESEQAPEHAKAEDTGLQAGREQSSAPPAARTKLGSRLGSLLRKSGKVSAPEPRSHVKEVPSDDAARQDEVASADQLGADSGDEQDEVQTWTRTSLQLAQRWTELARRHSLDIVWFMNPPGFPIGLPYIATVWDLEHRKQPYFPEVSISGWTWDRRETIFRVSLPRATFVLTGTETGKSEIERFYGVYPDRVRVIPFPAPVPDEGEAGAPDPDIVAICATRPFIFYPAQQWPHKNHVNLLMAMRNLVDGGRKLNLIFTGGDMGNRDFVCRKTADLSLLDHVFDLGFVSRASLNYLYRNACALVFPSFFGPDNLPPLEAFAAGCPVAASDVPGARDQLADGALFFDPTQPGDIARKIAELCDDTVLRSRLITEGKGIAAVRTPTLYASAILSLLDEFRRIRRCWGPDYTHV